MSAPVIDFHAHVLEPEALKQCAPHSVATGFGARPMAPGTPGFNLMAGMLDPEIQISDMDRKGISRSVISTATVVQSTWWADAALAAELDRRANQRIAEWVERYPARFTGTFTIPMHHIDAAIKELEFAVSKLNLRIANVSSNAGGFYLGDPKFREFWEAVVHHDLTVLIHPHGVTDPRFQKFALWNGVGQPIEETMAIASLIYEGIFETFPGVKVVIVHGGGYLPHYTRRLDRNYTMHPMSAQNIKKIPTEYLRSLYYDSCVYGNDVLEALVRRVGADRIIFGTDYPFGEEDPVGNLAKAEGLSDDDRNRILSITPASLAPALSQ
ncbi:MAG TPA: amidohydrolase family protein [Bryobacteraceae bacterium]|nr:amidohydrolase family protein [Bryobacteraceae bacterium]